MRRTLRDFHLKWKHDERGSGTFFLYLGLMSLILAFAGLAIDTTISINARQESLNTLNSATVAAATQTNLNSQNLDYNKARATAIDMYSRNRANIPVSCGTGAKASQAKGVLVGNPSCPFILTDFQIKSAAQNAAETGGRLNKPSAIATVYECSPNFFIAIIQKELCYSVTSTGRLSNVLE